MIQVKTEILIKDNSGFQQGTCINCQPRKKGAKVGHSLKVAITKSKRALRAMPRSSISSKEVLQNLLVIQTRKPIMRLDGSTIKFNWNCGVSISFKKAPKNRLQLGFKRINTVLPFELRKRSHWQQFQGTFNIIKLAKNLI